MGKRMIRVKRVAGLIYGLILFAFSMQAQEARVEARLDTNKLLIGDQVRLHFTFTGPAGAHIQWPVLPDTLYNNIQVVSRSAPDTSWSQDRKNATIHQQVVLTTFDSGFYTIPPIPFYYRTLPDTTGKMVETHMLLFEVATLAVDTTQAIKPIKGPVKIPLTWREILPWILLFLVVTGAITFLVYFIRRRKKKAPLFSLAAKPVLKPHEIALKALEELRLRKSWQAGRFKEFHSDLTDILRAYIESRFAVRALESTTDEILDGMRSCEGIRPQNIPQLQKILQLADLVKFAKTIPVGGENEESLDLGITFVKETAPGQETIVEPAEKP